jgi:hypothetical protein
MAMTLAVLSGLVAGVILAVVTPRLAPVVIHQYRQLNTSLIVCLHLNTLPDDAARARSLQRAGFQALLLGSTFLLIMAALAGLLLWPLACTALTLMDGVVQSVVLALVYFGLKSTFHVRSQ